MTSADVMALVLLLAMAAYACGGGADFGAGFWDLTAGDRDEGARPRALVDGAMAPVWEANHVWLVFVLIITWTGFPQVFEAVVSTTWVAVILGGLGIVLRGVGFAFRKPTLQAARRRRYGTLFGLASIVAPFFLAAAVGGVASGRVPVGNRAGDPVTSWLNPTSLLFGVLAVAATAFIAAVFLARDARRLGEPDLEGYFRRRAVAAGTAVLVVALAGLLVLRADARHVFDGLLAGWGLVFAVTALVATAATVGLVARGVRRGTRVTTVVALASLVLAWGMAQRPYLLPSSLTVADGAGDPDTLRWLLIVTAVAVVVVAPALALLYRLDLSDRLRADHDADLVEDASLRGDGRVAP